MCPAGARKGGRQKVPSAIKTETYPFFRCSMTNDLLRFYKRITIFEFMVVGEYFSQPRVPHFTAVKAELVAEQDTTGVLCLIGAEFLKL
jgi:hypothetical protein